MSNLPPIISYKIRGLEEVQAFLKSLPKGTIKVALAAMSTYVLGNQSHGLRYNPKRISHGKGNPYRWQSDKQRKAFFASNGFGGGIPSKRSGDLSKGWQQSAESDPYRKTLFNRIPYARFVQGDDQQRGHAADKWRKVGQIIADNIKGGMRAANQAVARWIKENTR